MVAAVTTTTAGQRTDATRTAMATNFETFLSLLTAQLKNQDPLAPVDSNQFTSQLTQMSGVEQQLLTNDLLTSLLAAQQGGGLSGAANYIGKDATAAWAANKLVAGQATWSYELGADAAKSTLQVLNGSGQVVWSGDTPDRTAGIHDFTWNGQTTGGGQLADGGVYTLKITAKGGNDTAIDSQVLVRGRISGVELYDGEPYLTVGNSILPLSTVIALQERAAAPPIGGTA
ncbi:flagellar hook capping FlgD N-terminal domain-containing protein [uncultured Brevundimonas sp.]|uniref:flagellar hook assembly protein FlgD n=1 Tax=uncultured Brevundimonas sp. TaxID=213418 RepID=UPI0030EB70D5|tara:strand:+ start:43588 stop:44277 length:690 start_codon:yes stop_codon:yes gene_type:complete